MDNKFKDSQGRWRTGSLFWERGYDPETALYSMKETDHPDGYPSFRRLYLELADTEEYLQAMKLVGGWDHWKILCSSKWFNDYIEPIREELEIKIRSQALLQAYNLMFSEKSSALAAAKMFSDGRYKGPRKRGRPSNKEVNAEVAKQAEITRRVREDAERIGLEVVVDND